MAASMLLLGYGFFQNVCKLGSAVRDSSVKFKYFVRYEYSASRVELKALRSCPDLIMVGSSLTNEMFLSHAFEAVLGRVIDLLLTFR
jgi:hypothetical protein